MSSAAIKATAPHWATRKRRKSTASAEAVTRPRTGAGRKAGVPELLPRAEARMKITFERLMEIGHDLSGVGDGFKNYQTALRRYLKAKGIPSAAYVPESLVEDLDRFANEELPDLVSPGQLRQQRSFTNRWGLYWTDWITGATLPRKFSSALQQLMDESGVSQKALADHLGVDPSTVRGYQKGRHKPGKRILRSLEAYFGLREGVLGGRVEPERNGPVNYPRVSLMEFPEWLQGDDNASRRLRTQVRKHLDSDYDHLPRAKQLEEFRARCDEVADEFKRNKIIRSGYRLPLSAWPETARADWASLVAFKRGPVGAAGGDGAATGTRKRVRIAKRQAQQPTLIRPGKSWGPRSVEYHLRIIENYFGYLVSPLVDREDDPDLPRGGKGMRPEELSLGLLLDASLLLDFVEFQADRAGDYNTTSERIFSFATSLVHERRGWFRANPQLQEQLTPQQLNDIRLLYGIVGAQEDLWRAICDGCVRDLRAYKSDVRALKGPSRRTFKKLKPILDLDFPLDVVYEMHDLAEADMRRQRDPIRRARLLADLVKSGILAETSLRGGHLPLMRVDVHLCRVNGRFYFVIPVHEFKNSDSAIFEGVGEVIFELEDPDLQRWLTEYVDVVLPAIRSQDSDDFLFPVFSSGRKPTASYTASRIGAFIRRYLRHTTFGDDVRAVGEFGPHAYRYIKAGSLIKMEGGSLELAANALLDTEDVADEVYAYIRASRRHEKSAQMVRAHRARRKARTWPREAPKLIRG